MQTAFLYAAAFIEAERAGLVSRIVPAKKLMDEAQSAAQKIAEKSMLTVMAVKEAVNRAEEVSLREGLLFERRLFHSMFATEDQKEGMAAFMEKREALVEELLYEQEQLTDKCDYYHGLIETIIITGHAKSSEG